MNHTLQKEQFYRHTVVGLHVSAKRCAKVSISPQLDNHPIIVEFCTVATWISSQDDSKGTKQNPQWSKEEPTSKSWKGLRTSPELVNTSVLFVSHWQRITEEVIDLQEKQCCTPDSWQRQSWQSKTRLGNVLWINEVLLTYQTYYKPQASWPTIRSTLIHAVPFDGAQSRQRGISVVEKILALLGQYRECAS